MVTMYWGEESSNSLTSSVCLSPVLKFPQFSHVESTVHSRATESDKSNASLVNDVHTEISFN